MPSPITRQEIEQKMDELAREYRETHDPEIREEIYRSADQLWKMEKECLARFTWSNAEKNR